MMIWVTPLELTSESLPIAEFVVTVSHIIDGHPVSSHTAIDQAHADCMSNTTLSRFLLSCICRGSELQDLAILPTNEADLGRLQRNTIPTVQADTP
jgi:hypothetical protein